MIGIFDSGAGGLCALRELARLLPDEKKIYLTDRKNLPYGTKSEGELVLLVSENIRKLRFMGCEKILLACCTASTIHPLLPREYKELSLPIIGAAARAVRGERIAVIATERTVCTGAFRAAISVFCDAEIFEIPAGELVPLVESGERDGHLSERGKAAVARVAREVALTEPDSLILGCTHFSHLEESFGALLPDVHIVSAAREGALEMVKNKGNKTEKDIKKWQITEEEE